MQPGQVILDRTERTDRPEHDSKDITFITGHPGQDSGYLTDRKDNRNMTARRIAGAGELRTRVLGQDRTLAMKR
jgi:hypothetical protein